MADLLVAPCSFDAAKFAVERWHYSRCLPAGKLVRFGVWEDGRFVGVVVFSRGASPYLGRAYDLDHVELCELTRVALTAHVSPVSQIVAAALRQLRRSNPGLRLVVSFADPREGHHGGIYQAGNWVYTGQADAARYHYVDGAWRHRRGAFYDGDGRPRPAVVRYRVGEHRYLYPFDRAMRRQIEALRLPFPTRSRAQG